MKKTKEIVGVLSQIVQVLSNKTAKDGGPGSGRKGHTTAEVDKHEQASINENLRVAAQKKKERQDDIDYRKSEGKRETRHMFDLGAKNIAAGLEQSRSDTESSSKKFPLGSKVKTHNQGSGTHEVIGHSKNMVYTTGGVFHNTKIKGA